MKKKNEINILTYGGLGDTVLLTPSLKALRQQHPAAKINVFCLQAKHKEILKHNPYVDTISDARFWSAPLKWIRFRLGTLRILTYDYMWVHPTRADSAHIVD